MATYFPQTRERFLDIHGVGAVKYERYGEKFLDLICRYCRKHHIEPLPPKSPKPKRVKTDNVPQSPQKPRYVLVAEAYNKGDTIDTIMARYGIKLARVFDHFLKYLRTGNSLRTNEFLSFSSLSAEQNDAVLKAFGRLGAEYLKPVFDAFDGKIEYEDLKVLRLYALALQNQNLQKDAVDVQADSH
jgi:ATP-dependent DNA helicase RecQ